MLCKSSGQKKRGSRQGVYAYKDTASQAEMGHIGWKQSNLRTTEERPDQMQYAEKEGKAEGVGEGGCSAWRSLKLTNEGQSTAKQEDKPASD